MENLLVPYSADSALPARSAICFAPHPDDEVFGCGGALARHVTLGVPVQVVVLTDGAFGASDATACRESRAAESRAAAAVLGYSAPDFWGLPDRALEYNETLVKRLQTAITEAGADLVYAPSPYEMHPDHRALALAAGEAVRRLAGSVGLRIAFYEVGHPLPPNLLLDISNLADLKLRAMRCFPSQLERQPYDQHIAALNRYRTYTLPGSVTSAEAFHICTAAELATDPLGLFAPEYVRQVRLGVPLAATGPLTKVSVIVRSMDRPFLRDALDSLALQTWPCLEVVVVNAKGGAHRALGDRCGRNALIMVNDGGAGLDRPYACNAGLDAASGDWLAFLDDDDTLDPDHVAGLVAALSKQPDYRVAYAGVRCIDRADPERKPFHVFNDPFDPALLLLQNFLPIHASLFHRSLLRAGARVDESLPVYEDWDFWLQLSRITPFLHVDQVSATYFMSGTSAVGISNAEKARKQVLASAIYQKWSSRLAAPDLERLAELTAAHKDARLSAEASLARKGAEAAEQLEQFRQAAEQRIQAAENQGHELGGQLAAAEGRALDLAEQLEVAEQRRKSLAVQLDASESSARMASAQLQQVVSSRSWRITSPLRSACNYARGLRGRARAWLDRPRSTVAPVASAGARYGAWLDAGDPEEARDIAWLDEARAAGRELPLISIAMPVFNPEPAWLAEAIASVRRQVYPQWELCIADDCSTDSRIRPLLERAAAEDDRIRVVFRSQNGHISAASNSALGLALGEFVALLDHDDCLHAHALVAMARCIDTQPDADLIYSDEDKLDESGHRVLPFMKPDWSPHLAIAQAYLGHLVCIRRSLLAALGGWRDGLDGAQDYDLWLRASLKARGIQHVPRVLYHWRMHPQSTAQSSNSKPYAHAAGLKAVDDYLHARYPGMNISAQEGQFLFTYRANFTIPGNTKISIIIPTRDNADLLRACIASIAEKSSWRNFDILVLDNGSQEAATFAYFEQLARSTLPVRVVKADMPFNWSRLNNNGARQTSADVLVFLNNDTEVISPDWLEQLAGYAQLPDAGVVGGLLLFEDGSIQHDGVVVGMGGWADHVYRTQAPVHSGGGPFISPVLTRNALAVTGACMAITRDKFDRLGGFDESFTVCGSDVELCLRAYRAGLFNVVCAEARLYHLESKTRSPHVPAEDFVQSDLKYAPWRTQDIDPFYNPNLSLTSTFPTLRTAP